MSGAGYGIVQEFSRSDFGFGYAESLQDLSNLKWLGDVELLKWRHESIVRSVVPAGDVVGDAGRISQPRFFKSREDGSLTESPRQ